MQPEIVGFEKDQDPDGFQFLQYYLRECVTLNPKDEFARNMLPLPYLLADFKIESLEPEHILPTAKYVLRGNLDTVKDLYERLLPMGIDILNLRGIVKLDETNLICPPILEFTGEFPLPVIVDGAHRIFFARTMGLNINCVVISGKIPHMLPMKPLTAGWNAVAIHDTVPADKRDYEEIPYPWSASDLYRDGLPGSKGIRPTPGKLSA